VVHKGELDHGPFCAYGGCAVPLTFKATGSRSRARDGGVAAASYLRGMFVDRSFRAEVSGELRCMMKRRISRGGASSLH
jgi:hypothetical protein